MAALDFSIDVPIRSEWDSVERLRASIDGCMKAMSGDAEGGHAVSLVAAELAENAIKYGDWTGGETTFRVRVSGDDRHAQVVVENPVDRAGASRLFDTLRWIEAFPTARDAYEARLLEIAAAEPDATTSRMGLVRLVYEASCTLKAELDRGLIRVVAEVVFS